MVKTVSIFGLTGSIGMQAADIVMADRPAFDVDTITAHKNVEELAAKAIELEAKHCVIGDASLLAELQSRLAGTEISAAAGREAVLEAAIRPVDISLQAIIGFEGVAPSITAAKHAKTLALANKEALVCAGRLLKAECETNKTQLIPLDSEHSAIFQCLGTEKDLSKIILTASGGPFWKHSAEELQKVTLEEASTHPNWDMGQRITIDSASMFNKAMEMIEAQMLFDLRPDQIEVVIHPQSALHSAVEFEDGAIIAHLGATDMRAPIGYALYYPERKNVLGTGFSLAQLGQMEFFAPDAERFPALCLAEKAMSIGGDAGLVLNAAKEVALDQFIDGKIPFLNMADGVAHSLEVYEKSSKSSYDGLDELVALNDEYRQVALDYFEGKRA